MSEPVITPAAAAPTASLGDLNLTDYRATRDGKPPVEKPAAAAPVAAPATPAPAPKPAEAPAAEPVAAPGDEDEIELDPATGEPILEQDGKPKRSTRGYKRTIEKLKGQLADAQRLAAPAAVAATPPAAPTPAAPALPAFSKPKPQLADFGTIEDHTEALVDWRLEKRDFEQAAVTRQKALEAAGQKLVDVWENKLADFKVDKPDYQTVVAAASKVKIPDELQRTIAESEFGPAIAYELASSVDGDYKELRRIGALSPLNAAREIGKIEARLAAAAAPPPPVPVVDKPVSGAPPPIKPVSTRAGSTVLPSISNMSTADYRAARESGRIS